MCVHYTRDFSKSVIVYASFILPIKKKKLTHIITLSQLLQITVFAILRLLDFSNNFYFRSQGLQFLLELLGCLSF
jgi:hypothetical protein